MYLALLPQFLSPAGGNVLSQSLLLGFTQILISVSVNAIIALSAGSMAAFSSSARPGAWRNAGSWVRCWAGWR